jgi:DNA-binding HxlR family transcriptional regulator
MTKYGQFCPVAKSAEILGDPWTLLIVRELLLGSCRFNLLQRGLPRISPTVLNTRLKQLEERGVINKRRLTGRRGHDYRLTASGRELLPIVEGLAVWGMRWALDEVKTSDCDVSFLMFDMQRRIDTTALPDGETVIGVHFTDLKKFGQWWLICKSKDVDLCYEDPGKDVDCFVSGTSRDMIDVWMGALPLTQALRSDRILVTGDRQLCRSLPRWFLLAVYAGTPRPTTDERLAG